MTVSVGRSAFGVFFLSLLACRDTKIVEQQQAPQSAESVQKKELESEKSRQPAEMKIVEVQEDVVISKDPLSVQVDTSKINVMFSNFFRTDEALSILFDGFEGRLGGDVRITTYPPVYEERKKPRIFLSLSPSQFAGLTPMGPSGMDTKRLVQVLETLNQYRKHIGSNSEQRVFHFWIGVQVEECTYFPSNQETFVAVTHIDPCVLYKEKKVCGEQEGTSIRKLPQACRPIEK